MITPLIETYGRKKVEPGDKVVLIRSVQGPYFVISTGHVLTYIGCETGQNPGEMLRDEETGLIVKHVSILDYQIYEPSLEKARKIYIDKKEEQEFIKFVKDNCSYNRFDRCYNKDNMPDFDGCKSTCIEYVKEDKYKDNEFILNYKRKLKLKKLQEEI